MTRKIVLDYIFPPIATRGCDWMARFADFSDPKDPVGYGETQDEAIAELFKQTELSAIDKLF